MYDKIFKEHKLVAIYSVSIVFMVLLAVFAAGSRKTYNTSAAPTEPLVRGCYYRLDCPPNNQGTNAQFRCEPLLVCPTTSLFPQPSVSAEPRTYVKCNDCFANNTSTLCLNPVNKIAYCTNNFVPVPEDTCIRCTATTPFPSVSRTRTPTFGPTRSYSIYPTRQLSPIIYPTIEFGR